MKAIQDVQKTEMGLVVTYTDGTTKRWCNRYPANAWNWYLEHYVYPEQRREQDRMREELKKTQANPTNIKTCELLPDGRYKVTYYYTGATRTFAGATKAITAFLEFDREWNKTQLH